MALFYDRIQGRKTSTAIVHVLQMQMMPDSEEEMKWILDPPFQRGSVWTVKQKQAWWDSILDNLPVPAIFINRFPHNEEPEGYRGREIVIDGRQRIEAIMGFLRGDFKVRGETWDEQSLPFKRFVLYGFNEVIITTEFKTIKECAELYLKLLQAGTQHTIEEIEKAKEFVKGQP